MSLVSKSSLRVVWLCLEWPNSQGHSGGVARYSARLAEEVGKLVELTVIAFEGGVEIEGVQMVFISKPGGRFARYYLSPRQAASEARVRSADVVHAHGDDWWLKSTVPVVRSFYGTAAGEARSSVGLRRVNHWLLALLERRAARRATRRLAIAPESMTAFSCHELFPPILLDRPRLVDAPSQVASLVFIGSYHGRKRGYLALQAAEVCRRSIPNLRFVVIGPASDRGSWPAWVEHRSGLRDSDVQGVLSTAWALLAPSSYEGFGIPVVEGLAAGSRVFATPNPGCDFIASMGGPEVPLEVFSPDGFAADVGRRLRPPPEPGSDEAIAAGACVDAMIERGSPERLVSIYRAVAKY